MQDERATKRAGSGEGTPAKGPEWIYGALSDIPKIITESLQHLQRIADENEAASPENFQATISGIAGSIAETLQRIINGNAVFSENEKAIAAFTASQADNIPEDLQPIAPYLLDELKAAPEHAGTPIAEVLKAGIDDSGNLTDSPYREIITRAQQRAQIDTALHTAVNSLQVLERASTEIGEIKGTGTATPAEDLPRIRSQTPDRVTYPLDKPNSYIWNLLESANNNGQISLAINTASEADKKQGKAAIVAYSLSFANFDELDNVRITKQLTPFDKRVYIAVAALYEAGNKIINVQQIYETMGYKGQAAQYQLERINNSLTKMRTALVYIDNADEIEINTKYPRFRYDGQLLEFRRISAYTRNNIRSDEAIFLLAYPPVIDFAKKRGQITSVPRYLLESPISKTDANLMIDDYLLERISHMKNNRNLTRKMLYRTIYEQCQIKTSSQISRAPEKIKRYLDYYKQCGFIIGYTEQKDGILIEL